MPKHFRHFTNTNNLETMEMMPRINEILVWFWRFLGIWWHSSKKFPMVVAQLGLHQLNQNWLSIQW